MAVSRLFKAYTAGGKGGRVSPIIWGAVVVCLCVCVCLALSVAGRGGGGGGVVCFRWQGIPLMLDTRGGFCFFFCLLLFWLGVALAGHRAGACPVCLPLCLFSVAVWPARGGDQGKAKPLSRGLGVRSVALCVYCLTLFLLSSTIRPPNNTAVKAVRP